MRGRLVVLSVVLGLNACATYRPVPTHPETFPARFDALRLDARRDQPWTGADLLDAAVSRNPTLKAARERYRAARAAIDVAKVRAAPTLTLTGEYANQSPTWGYSGSVEIPLDVGARRMGRITTADLHALQALYDYVEAVWTVRAAIEAGRIEIASADEEIALADQARMLRQDRLARLDRRVASGEDMRALAIQAQTELAAAERRLAEARARRTRGALGLAAALGVPASAVQGLTLAPIAPPPPLDDLAAWRRDAAVSRRDVLKAVADYDLAEAALRVEVARQYPELRLTPGYNYDHGVTKLPLGLAVVLPPYDLNRSGIAQAEAARAAAGRSLEATQAAVLSAVDTAAQTLVGARQVAEGVRQGEVATAERSVASTVRALHAGAADRTDDLAARAAAVGARLNLLDAERAARIAAADLETALRRPFDPAEADRLTQTLNREIGPR